MIINYCPGNKLYKVRHLGISNGWRVRLVGKRSGFWKRSGSLPSRPCWRREQALHYSGISILHRFPLILYYSVGLLIDLWHGFLNFLRIDRFLRLDYVLNSFLLHSEIWVEVFFLFCSRKARLISSFHTIFVFLCSYVKWLETRKWDHIVNFFSVIQLCYC